jgi:hypothetical protein
MEKLEPVDLEGRFVRLETDACNLQSQRALEKVGAAGEAGAERGA